MSIEKGYSFNIKGDDGLTVSYGDNAAPKQSPLLSKLKEFEDPSDSILISELNKKKRKNKPKKKRSKKKAINKDIVTSTGRIVTEDEYRAMNEGDELSALLHEDELDAQLYDPDELDSDELVKTQRNSYGERKKSSDKFKKEFAEDVVLLYDTLKVLNNIGDGVISQLDAFTKSRARGVNKAINDLITNAVTIQNARLSTIKEITNVKKTIIDLGIKDAKNNPEVNENDKQLTASYLAMLMDNRSNLIGQMAGVGDGTSGSVNTGAIMDPYTAILSEESRTRDEIKEEFESELVERKTTSYTGNQIDDVDFLMEDRLENEGNPNRTSSGSKNIELELNGVKVVVYLNALDSQKWEFVAVDRDGMEVTDYSDLPDKITVGNMTFNEHYAKDSYGRVYDIIRYTPENNTEEFDY